MSNFLYALAESIALSYLKQIQDWIDTKRRQKRTGTCKCWTLKQNPYLPGQKEKEGSTIGVLKSCFPAFFFSQSRHPAPFYTRILIPPHFFLRDFWHFLLDHWNSCYDLPFNNCQFWWSRFSTSQLATITLFFRPHIGTCLPLPLLLSLQGKKSKVSGLVDAFLIFGFGKYWNGLKKYYSTNRTVRYCQLGF